MNKLFTKIATATLGVAMAIGVGIAVNHKSDARAAEAAEKDTDTGSVYTVDLSGKGYSNASNVTTVSLLTGAHFSMVFAKNTGSNAPKWYDSGSSVRTYEKNTLTITPAEGYQITAISFTYDSNKGETANIGTLSDDKTSWSGTSTHDSPLILTTGSTQARYKTLAISYSAQSSDPVLSIDNYDGTYGTNYILPSEEGAFGFSWDVSTPDIDKGTITWSTSGTNASKITVTPGTGEFVASSDVTTKTEVTINLLIVDNNSKQHNATKNVYVCPHILASDATLSRESLKNEFVIDDTITIVESGAKLKTTFMDAGLIDVLAEENLYGGTLSYSIGGVAVASDHKMLKSDNGKNLIVSYTFGDKTVSALGYAITVKDKDIDDPSVTAGWNLVKDVASLEAGDQIILASNGDTAVAIGATQQDKYREKTAVTKATGNASLTDIKSAVQFTVGIISSGTYQGCYTFYGATTLGQDVTSSSVDSSGKGYLTAVSGSNILRTNSSGTGQGQAWTISIANDGSANIASKHATTRYIRYNTSTQDFRTYQSSSSDVNALFIYKYMEPTKEDYVQHWVATYLHFQDIAIADESDGTACKADGTGYYLIAKAALATLETEHTGCINELKTNAKFSDARDRYEAWARANRDGAPYDGNSGIVTPASAVITIHENKTNNVAIVVAVIASTSLVALFGLLVLRKKKEQ